MEFHLIPYKMQYHKIPVSSILAELELDGDFQK